MGKLDGKTAIITGAAGGIGLEIARRFNQEGAGLVICDRKQDQLENAQEKLPDFFASLRSLHPLGRNTKPKDVADAALFLASDHSEFITGVLLNVDGGRHLATNRPPAA